MMNDHGAPVTVDDYGAAVMMDDHGASMTDDNLRFLDGSLDRLGRQGARDRRGFGYASHHAEAQHGGDNPVSEAFQHNTRGNYGHFMCS